MREGLQVVAMPLGPHPAATRPPSPARAGEGEESLSRLRERGGGEGSFLPRLREAFGDRLWVGASLTYGEDMRGALARRAALARKIGAPLLATNDVVMHAYERRPLADVLACIREGTTLEAAGRLTQANAERHLKDADEMTRLFAEAPKAVEETARFLDGLAFSLDELAHDYPEELREGYATAQAALEAFADSGARARYPGGVPDSVRAALAHELALIGRLDYAPYFLTVHDIVRFARSRGILCQGRGSAANSTVCFCLGITEVDPARFDLLFERFVSPERNEPPDIDVDFEHERRDEVIQYIYARYGRERAGLAAAVTTYRTRSAIRETAKAFGLSDDIVVALNSMSWGHDSAAIGEERARAAGLDPSDPTLALALKMAEELTGFPRHLTQHSGGFVITRDRLDEVAPIMNAAMEDRTTIEWDKDDLDALGILKVDVLALGMLTALSKGFALLDRHYGEALTLATVPPEEACVYAMIQRADTIGVFQIESRAQMSMLPRLKPEKFYDLVIEVAIVRPGPIQGDMVHPYLRRRQGVEDVVYPSRELEAVLGKTLGVPLFQEQAMKIAIVAAGFTPAEADKLRRAMATFRRVGTIATFQAKMVEGMVGQGLRSRVRRALLPPDRRFWRIRLPREPCGEFRAARLRLLLDEMPLSRRLPRRDAQFPAARLLRPLAARARRARTWGRGAGSGREPLGLGLHAGGAPFSPCGRGWRRSARMRAWREAAFAADPHPAAFAATFSRKREKGRPPPPPRLHGRPYPLRARRAARPAPDHRRARGGDAQARRSARDGL